MPNSGNLPAWGTIDLSKSAAVGTSILGLANGGWGVNVATSIASKTTTYPITSSDYVLLLSSSAFTVTLPSAASNPGKQYVLKKTDSSLANIITVATTGGQTIDGSATTTLNTQYETVVLGSDGSNWVTINRSAPSTWNSFTGLITALSSNPTCSVFASSNYWRRVGTSMQIVWYVNTNACTCSGAGSGRLLFNIPTNAAIDTSITQTTDTTVVAVGTANVNVNGSAFASAASSVGVYDSTHLDVNAASVGGLTAANFVLTSSNGILAFSASVPISGWK